QVRPPVQLDADSLRGIGGPAAANQSLVRRTSRFLRRAREPLLAKNRGRLVEIAVRLRERRLAVHHARAGLIAELLHHVRRDRCRCHIACSEMAAPKRPRYHMEKDPPHHVSRPSSPSTPRTTPAPTRARAHNSTSRT